MVARMAEFVTRMELATVQETLPVLIAVFLARKQDLLPVFAMGQVAALCPGTACATRLIMDRTAAFAQF